MKTVLVTGSNGFVGKNLVVTLLQRTDIRVTGFDSDDDPATLPALVREADFIFHLAGVNRPQNLEEFTSGNAGLTQTLISHLVGQGATTPLLISSSIQAAQDNPYGVSKRQAEEAVFAYGKQTGAPVYVYRLPNVFGKWCRPNYNSAVATFCNNIAHDLPIQINDPSVTMNLVYIDDVVTDFMAALDGEPRVADPYCQVHPVHAITLGGIVELIHSFKESRANLIVPDMSAPFTKKLYSTYLSYLPQDNFSYPLKMNVDQRGSFTEFIKTADRGQVSVNISKPGITKGNHWHHTKNEKFLVVSGQGLIRFRAVGGAEVIDYHVSGDKLEVVDIPTGYTHSITNTGASDLVTVMWCNEMFDPEKPDTYFEAVDSKL
ncbi:MAG: capsular polysaccharide biosynthesis protein CapF [Desulfuromonadales bacterium]|nr:capsular polysaccharide biosynthesis protein CapF [Desulfuromonadales bacterium]